VVVLGGGRDNEKEEEKRTVVRGYRSERATKKKGEITVFI
jgi:hypothetical protein